MNLALSHRGPDSSGIWTSADGRCGLGHTRLSILDLSAAGNQPMTFEEKSLAMVFNGEVYNFESLRAELVTLGHRFRGHSDSEVVLHAFAEWGPDSFQRFNGMFAVAFADERSGRICIARDRLGIKPLHYTIDENRLAFSSEIKGLLRSGLKAARADFSRIAEYMYFGVTLGESTLLEGVRRLPPGTFAEYDIVTGRFDVHEYWDVQELAHSVPIPPGVDTSREVLRLLEASVKRHLVSDVPVGVFLSGGIDSSAIVALATRHYQGRLRTYSVDFDYVADTNELPRARLVAQKFRTDHHEIRVTGTNLTDLLERLVNAHDLPFSDAANIPLYQLCSAMGSDTKVVLQGDGGDEVFGGYRRYELLDRVSMIGPLARMVSPFLNLGFMPERVKPLRRMASAMAERSPAQRMALLLTTEEVSSSPLRVLTPWLRELASTQDPFARYRECSRNLQSSDVVQNMLLTDLQVILPDIFLEKVDRATMACSVEARVPFLDNELIDFVARLPAKEKVRFGHKKRLLRAALRGIVPDEILDAPKAGFGVPYARWMRGEVGEFLRILAIDPTAHAAGLFDTIALARTLREHQTGKRNHGFLLWKCLQLALWSTAILGQPTRQLANWPK
jgi:asparagine synthase (glutamine-hydrolysing)